MVAHHKIKKASKQASKYYKNFCFFKMINSFLLFDTGQNSILMLFFYPLFFYFGLRYQSKNAENN
ncbi:hypothetical protein QV03_03150 [Gallibacterium anatis]|uniref:Uncharacterized protein n=1 Tax=Gallibacterium anatis TaxID=750 RepID=A0A1A7PBJ4_9PAST|nr:hypothetical protein QV03_03150 [Gallibacterium anatis]